MNGITAWEKHRSFAEGTKQDQGSMCSDHLSLLCTAIILMQAHTLSQQAREFAEWHDGSSQWKADSCPETSLSLFRPMLYFVQQTQIVPANMSMWFIAETIRKESLQTSNSLPGISCNQFDVKLIWRHSVACQMCKINCASCCSCKWTHWHIIGICMSSLAATAHIQVASKNYFDKWDAPSKGAHLHLLL